MAGEGSAGGASGRPVSGVDGAVRGFASFDRGAAPWPSGGEECSSCCPRTAAGRLAGGVMAPREVRGGSQRRRACRAGAGGGGGGEVGPCELL